MNLPLIINQIRLQLYAIDKGLVGNRAMETRLMEASFSPTSPSSEQQMPISSSFGLLRTTGKYSKLFHDLWHSSIHSSTVENPILSSTTTSVKPTSNQASQNVPSLMKRMARVLRPSRLYKITDRDHPFSVMKQNYETLVEYLRLNPKLFCRILKDWIANQFHPHELVSLVVLMQQNEDPYIHRMGYVLVFSFYGNTGNSLEAKCLAQFIKHTIKTVFELCSDENAFEFFENAFLNQTILLYMRRIGKEFLKSVVKECLVDLFSDEDFDVPVLVVMEDKPVEGKKPPPPSRSPFNFFPGSQCMNTDDASPMSPDAVTFKFSRYLEKATCKLNHDFIYHLRD